MDEFRKQCKEKPYCTVLPPPHPTYDICQVIQDAFREDDAGVGDATCLATIPEDAQATATFLSKAKGVIAGLAVADAVFEACDIGIQIQWRKNEGDCVELGEEFGTVRGRARSLLRAERVALNFMQRMSGVATITKHMVSCCKGTKARILETRKTAPGLRLLDKWAVLIGGGQNHRMGLYDMIMIKDNHIAACGGLQQAVEKASAFARNADPKLPIEVETRTLKEVEEVMECLENDVNGLITRVMLDNMAKRDPNSLGGVDTTMLKEAVQLIGEKCETEASGNVTLETVGEIAKSGCDYISCGALTHSVTAHDISFNVVLDIA